MVEIPEHLRGHLTDSAGQPWAGRNFSENPWQDDRGEAPPKLLAAIRAFRAGEAPGSAVVDALRDSRLLIPLVAELGEASVNEHGQTVDKSADLSIVTVAAPDGRGVVPVFSSVAAMKAWDADARPVPVDARRAALAAVEAGSDVLILDAANLETEFVVRRPAVWAIAQAHDYIEPWTDPKVLQRIQPLLEIDPAVVGINVLPGDAQARFAGPEVQLVVELVDTEREHRQAVLHEIQQRIAADTELVQRIDSLSIAAAQATPSESIDQNPTSEPVTPTRRFGFGRRKRR
ncbi:SseB family protein [uncultured Gulosibacter sp.]|uniref:SseB family protein n=1 Tax=uncultured Gulosibacter sp. TaxID=1339167 RepID=UPI00288A6298|nr:SseB family protein [uncultured Gulosibacter sp.]